MKRNTKDGFDYWCKSCRHKYKNKYRSDNLEIIRLQEKVYYNQNITKLQHYSITYQRNRRKQLRNASLNIKTSIIPLKVFLTKKFSRILYAIRYRARKRKLKFNIDVQFIVNLFLKNRFLRCPCCKQKFDLRMFTKTYSLKVPSIDRFNINKGYTKDNVVIICLRCNIIKSNTTTGNELIQVGKWILKYERKLKLRND